jgi:hypothetical protein
MLLDNSLQTVRNRMQPREGAFLILSVFPVTPGSTGGKLPRPCSFGSATVGPGVFI